MMTSVRQKGTGISWLDNYFPVVGISIFYLIIIGPIATMLITDGTALNSIIVISFPNAFRFVALVFIGIVFSLLVYLAVIATRYMQHPKKFARSFYRSRYFGYFALSLLTGQVFHYGTFFSWLFEFWWVIHLALFEGLIPYVPEKREKPFSANSQLDYYKFYWYYFFITFSWLIESIFSAWGNWMVESIFFVLLGSNLVFFLNPVRNRDWFMQYFFWIQIVMGVISFIDGILRVIMGVDLIQGLNSGLSLLFVVSMLWYMYYKPETLLKQLASQIRDLGVNPKHIKKVEVRGITDPERPDHLFIAAKEDGTILLFVFETSKTPTQMDIDTFLELKNVIEQNEEVTVELLVMVVWGLKEEVREQAESQGIYCLSLDSLHPETPL